MQNKSLKYFAPVVFAAVSTAFAAPAALAETSVQFGTGFEYSSGDYGNPDDTTIYEIPFTVRLKSGNWSFRARVPVAGVDGPGGVVPGDDHGGDRIDNSGPGSSGGGGSDDGGGSTATGTSDEIGLADITLSGTYTFDLTDATYLDVTAKASPPTGGEEKDLGTVETAVSLNVELGADTDFGGVYVQGGYKQRGGALREDGASAVAGAYTRLTDGVLFGADVSWAEASRAGGDDFSSATAYTSFRLTDSLRLSVFAETGLSDASPDFGAGIGLTWKTNFRRPFSGQ